MKVIIGIEEFRRFETPTLWCCGAFMTIKGQSRKGDKWVIAYWCISCKKTVEVFQPYMVLKCERGNVDEI